MITLAKIRELDLAVAPTTGRPQHVSAASGLVCIGSFIYVVADDELHLGVFQTEHSEPGRLIRLFDGALPDSKPDRKKQKPDLEALTVLPPYGDCPHGALLAFGSGSTLHRRRGALLGLDAQGVVHGSPRAVDLSPILVALDDAFPELNIEGAIVSGDELCLFQRGNTRHPDNAVIRFPLAAVVDSLNSERHGAIKPSAIVPFDLGQIDGVPFCFSDAAALPDGGMIFTAIAENTEDSYNDGPCLGAAIGMANKDGRLHWMRRLDQPHKIEGVDVRVAGDGIRLLLVTDADDPAVPAGLFSTTIEG